MRQEQEQLPAIAVSLERKVNLGNYETANIYVGVSNVHSTEDLEYAMQLIEDNLDSIVDFLKAKAEAKIAALSGDKPSPSPKASPYAAKKPKGKFVPKKPVKVDPQILYLMEANGIENDEEWKSAALRAMEKTSPVSYFRAILRGAGLDDTLDPFAEE
jgi:hypothetical protein